MTLDDYTFGGMQSPELRRPETESARELRGHAGPWVMGRQSYAVP